MSQLSKWMKIRPAIRIFLWPFAGLVCAVPAYSETNGNIPGPPDVPLRDENNITIPSDYISVTVDQLNIGGSDGLNASISNVARPGSANISCGQDCRSQILSGFYRIFSPLTSFDGGLTFQNSISAPSGSSFTFSYGAVTERFAADPTGDVGASISGSGGTMVRNADGHSYTYTDRQGVRYHIEKNLQAGSSQYLYPVTSITYTNGIIVNIDHTVDSSSRRIRNVRNNLGWSVHYNYSNNAGSATNFEGWSNPAETIGYNAASEFCDTSSLNCSLVIARRGTMTWSTDFRTINIANAANEITRFTQDQFYQIVAIKPASSDVDTITYRMCSRIGMVNPTPAEPCSWLRNAGGINEWIIYPGMVYQATNRGQMTQYSSTIVASPYSFYTQYVNSYRGTSTLNQIGTPYNYATNGALGNYVAFDGTNYRFNGNAANRLMSVTRPTGRQTLYEYDSRGNAITIIDRAPAGSTEADLVQRITYPATCANIVVCNKPTAIMDARGAITDYTYDPIHGGLRTETGPADGNGVRPQRRLTYVQRYAWVKNATGAYVRASQPVWRVATEDWCRTSSFNGSTCATGDGDRVTMAYDYGPDSGPNNLLLRGMTVTSDGQTLRTCYGYNVFGDRVSETRPNANLVSCP